MPKVAPRKMVCSSCAKRALRIKTISYDAKIKHEHKLYEFNIPKLKIPICSNCGAKTFTEDVDEQINVCLEKHIKQLNKKSFMEREIHNLFLSCMDKIEQEIHTIGEQYNIARNLACSEWDDDELMIGMHPNRIIHERTKLLNGNYEMLRKEISFRKYLLIKAFTHTYPECFPLEANQMECLEHWEETLKEDDPDLGNKAPRANDLDK